MATRPNFVSKSNVGITKIESGDTTALQTVITGATGGTRVGALIATSDDTVVRLVQIWVNDGSNDSLIGTVNIPITAGFIKDAPAVNLFNVVDLPVLELDINGNPFIWLDASDIIKVGSTTTVTAAKTIYLTALGANNSF